MEGVVYDCGACPYLPDRQFHAFHPVPNPPNDIPYRTLMDLRFRRSGQNLYMPMCPGCNACRPIRVDVIGFMPRDDQRRTRKRNADLVVSWHARGLDDERRTLYTLYQHSIHQKEQRDDDPASFLVEDAGIGGGELHARNADGRLLAVSVVDIFPDAMSSVYCYYDPAERRRALGTFMALSELDRCRSTGLRWLYLGFLVNGCSKMEYKARYRPHEIQENGAWVRYQ